MIECCINLLTDERKGQILLTLNGIISWMNAYMRNFYQDLFQVSFTWMKTSSHLREHDNCGGGVPRDWILP